MHTGSTAFLLEIQAKDAEIARLKALLASCALIFERRTPVTTDFIEDLRKAAE